MIGLRAAQTLAYALGKPFVGQSGKLLDRMLAGELPGGTITKVQGSEVTINGNHPLAGETLNFDVEILGVRAATAEEIQHGHAHGGDGHAHDH